MESAPLLDLRDYPRIDAAGVADFYLLGDGRARFVMFDWQKIDGILRRVITGTVTRPVDTLREEQRRFWMQALKMQAPIDALVTLQ